MPGALRHVRVSRRRGPRAYSQPHAARPLLLRRHRARGARAPAAHGRCELRRVRGRRRPRRMRGGPRAGRTRLPRHRARDRAGRLGASGRSGGQAIVGYGTSQASLAARRSAPPRPRGRMWDVSVEALDWVRDRVARHGIDCDLNWGSPARGHPALDSAANCWPLQQELADVYGYHSPQFMERSDVEALLATTRYCAGLYDARSGHLHPLNYTLGLGAGRGRRWAPSSTRVRRSRASCRAIRCNSSRRAAP